MFLCSCSNGLKEKDGEPTTEEQAIEVTLESFAKANSLGSTLKSHKTVQLNTIYYDENGTEQFSECSIININGKQYVTQYEDSNGYVEFTYGDRTYIFDTEDNSFTIQFYVDNQQNEYMTRFKDSIFYISGNERLTDVHTAGGLTTVTVEKPVGDDTAYLEEFCDIASYDTVVFVYECSAKTLEIESVTVTVSAEGSDLLVCNSTYSYSDDSLTTPGFVSDLNNTKKTRIVTLHYDGITKYTIADEAKFGIDVPDGFALYSDAAGKKPLKNSEKAGADIEMYMLKTKESTTEQKKP